MDGFPVYDDTTTQHEMTGRVAVNLGGGGMIHFAQYGKHSPLGLTLIRRRRSNQKKKTQRNRQSVAACTFMSLGFPPACLV